MEKMSEFFSKMFEKIKGSKKVQFIIIGLFVALIGVVCYFSYKEDFDNEKTLSSQSSVTEKFVFDLENKILNIIEQIDGVSNANIAITLESGFEYVYAQESETKETSTGTLTTTELVFVSGQPVLVKELFPVVKGVVIVCDGAEDINVKLDILEAIQTVFEIENKNITILT